VDERGGGLTPHNVFDFGTPFRTIRILINLFLAMKEVFDKYDTKNQEFIKTSLLGKILRTLGFNPLESDIQRITKEIDPESNTKKNQNR